MATPHAKLGLHSVALSPFFLFFTRMRLMQTSCHPDLVTMMVVGSAPTDVCRQRSPFHQQVNQAYLKKISWNCRCPLSTVSWGTWPPPKSNLPTIWVLPQLIPSMTNSECSTVKQPLLQAGRGMVSKMLAVFKKRFWIFSKIHTW